MSLIAVSRTICPHCCRWALVIWWPPHSFAQWSSLSGHLLWNHTWTCEMPAHASEGFRNGPCWVVQLGEKLPVSFCIGVWLSPLLLTWRHLVVGLAPAAGLTCWATPVCTGFVPSGHCRVCPHRLLAASWFLFLFSAALMRAFFFFFKNKLVYFFFFLQMKNVIKKTENAKI